MGLNTKVANRGDSDTDSLTLDLASLMQADGRAHITYFDERTQASFFWDGKSEQIAVAIGGYGEPVDHLISDVRLRFDETYAQLILGRFEAIAKRHAATLPDYRGR